ncbi:glycosyltransferase family 2 protein [Desulfobulbus alkaliphilus]|uniref:glycosyltransferase family 2 protein n=1 Tax=Desulfobulbus alkaliphilus TaxID=869814 RepID=UPI0019662E9A|nr:glycosyltransferase family 2 protein [Desulfobulbus alkaliphilus]MBM9538609.1 glycosyltransferase family 2 protein [Desulfobulbus alkaliphilus]
MVDQSLAPVSVVIPCYRCADTIYRAVTSVYSQTWRPAEVILVEDCSGDSTLDQLHLLANKYPDNWVRVINLQKNSGPGTARNIGWDRARQPYIAFLDADDAWHPQKIEIQARWMLENPEVTLTGHGCVIAPANGGPPPPMYSYEEVQFKPVSPRRLLVSNCFSTPSVMLKYDLPQRFADGKYHSEDFLLWCEICINSYPCYRSSWPLAYLYKAAYGEGGLSSNLWAMEKGQLDTYLRLYKMYKISALKLYPLLLWSILRFTRRLLLSWWHIKMKK